MKVRCIKVFNAFGELQRSSPWLTIGATYDVLTVELERNGSWRVRLIGDNAQEPVLFSVDSFEIVSHRLAPSWVAEWTADGSFQLAPKAWLNVQFWERYYDRDPEALQTFETELAAIKETS